MQFRVEKPQIEFILVIFHALGSSISIYICTFINTEGLSGNNYFFIWKNICWTKNCIIWKTD